jgi:hypothetical protein
MIVGNGELDAGKAAPLERQQEVAPARPALAVGEIDAEDLPAAS